MNPDSLSHPMSILQVTEVVKCWYEDDHEHIEHFILLGSPFTLHFIQSLDEAPKGNTETLMEAV